MICIQVFNSNKILRAGVHAAVFKFLAFRAADVTIENRHRCMFPTQVFDAFCEKILVTSLQVHVKLGETSDDVTDLATSLGDLLQCGLSVT